MLLDSGADGADLRVRPKPWEDQFTEPLSEENRAFVQTSGKWTAFDVSTVGAVATLTGDVLASGEPVLSQAGKVTGMILRTGGEGAIRVDVQADELFLNELIPGRRGESR